MERAGLEEPEEPVEGPEEPEDANIELKRVADVEGRIIALTERFKVQFRAEAFNLANFAVLNIPDASLSDAKALGGNGNFGKITSSVSGSERHVQFALRLQF